MSSGAASYAGAALLMSAYVLGLDPLARALRSLIAGGPLSPTAADAAALAMAASAAAILRAARPNLHAAEASPKKAPRHVAAVACLSLSLLGLAALALRLLDPGFDAREFAARGLGNPGALRRLLLLIPFVVAAEELVFRTCQDWIRPALGSGVSSVAIGLAFALHHVEVGRGFGAHEAVLLLATSLGGMILAVLYETAPSVVIVAAVHLTYDVLALAQARLNVDGRLAGEAALFVAWIATPALAAWRLGWKDAWRYTLAVEHVPAGRWARAAAAAGFGIALPALLVFLRSRL